MRRVRCDAAARNTGADDTFGTRCCWRIQAPSKPSRSPYSNSRRVLSRPAYGSASLKLPGTSSDSDRTVGSDPAETSGADSVEMVIEYLP